MSQKHVREHGSLVAISSASARPKRTDEYTGHGCYEPKFQNHKPRLLKPRHAFILEAIKFATRRFTQPSLPLIEPSVNRSQANGHDREHHQVVRQDKPSFVNGNVGSEICSWDDQEGPRINPRGTNKAVIDLWGVCSITRAARRLKRVRRAHRHCQGMSVDMPVNAGLLCYKRDGFMLVLVWRVLKTPWREGAR